MTSFTMKPLYKAVFLVPLFVLFVAQPFQLTIAQQVSPTPTYDPLEEPPLPPNPTEYELGRNLYWHWCMTCHGDRGQGLTDEFRAIWEPEHQDCWGRGCHSGRPGEEGFPIPTVVPALVNENQLERFASLEELTEFLQETHPPQSPGVLKTEEYHAIALFVFTMNTRSLVSVPELTMTAPAPTPALVPEPRPVPRFPFVLALIFLVVLGLLVFAFTTVRKSTRRTL